MARGTFAAVEPVDYADTFIAVADDCPVDRGTVPPRGRGRPSVAARTHELIAGAPYRYTSGDVLFTVHAERAGIPDSDRPAARREFYAKGRPCLRSSPLGKRYGWGIHADADGRVALVGVGTTKNTEYVEGRQQASSSDPVRMVKAMRNARAAG